MAVPFPDAARVRFGSPRSEIREEAFASIDFVTVFFTALFLTALLETVDFFTADFRAGVVRVVTVAFLRTVVFTDFFLTTVTALSPAPASFVV